MGEDDVRKREFEGIISDIKRIVYIRIEKKAKILLLQLIKMTLIVLKSNYDSMVNMQVFIVFILQSNRKQIHPIWDLRILVRMF